jgi:hypothetical protein
MKHRLSHACRRRFKESRSGNEKALRNEPFGAGSGGGPGDGDHTKYYDGWHKAVSGQIGLWAEGITDPPAKPALIYLLSGLPGTSNGQINAHATQGIRLSVGQLPGAPTGENDSINGVEIQTGDTETIKITRGNDANPAKGEITFNLDGIDVNGNVGNITMESLQMIKLAVAGGVSSITLTPTGIIMQGPIIQIN